MTFQLSTGRITFTIIAALIEILLPIAAAIVVRRRLGVGWKYFGYGALIFLLFQLLTRVPIVQVVQALITPQLQASQTLLFGWLAILSFTAGLFEEVGRWVGYRWLMRRETKTWDKGIMYGLGHGGLESMLFVAGLTLLGLINLIVLSNTNIDALPLSPEQRAQLQQQLASVTSQPAWTALLGAWERIWALTLHVALSVTVLQVFRRGSLRWLWISIAAHTLVNFFSIGIPQLLGLSGLTSILVTEGIVAVVGIISLWVIWQLREPPEDVGVLVGGDLPEPPPLVAGAEVEVDDR